MPLKDQDVKIFSEKWPGNKELKLDRFILCCFGVKGENGESGNETRETYDWWESHDWRNGNHKFPSHAEMELTARLYRSQWKARSMQPLPQTLHWRT